MASTQSPAVATANHLDQAATSLRNRLKLNGEFSLLTGLIGAAAAGPIANLFEVDQAWIIRTLGFSLLGFAATLFVVARQPTSLVRSLAAVISAADIAWVVATAAVVSLGWLSTAGAGIMGLLALVVLGLAIAQLQAWQRLGDGAV